MNSEWEGRVNEKVKILLWQVTYNSIPCLGNMDLKSPLPSGTSMPGPRSSIVSGPVFLSFLIKLYIGRLFPSSVTGSSMFKPTGRRFSIFPADPVTWTGPDSFCVNGVTRPCSKQPRWLGGYGRLNGVGRAHCPFLEPGWELCPWSHIDQEWGSGGASKENQKQKVWERTDIKYRNSQVARWGFSSVRTRTNAVKENKTGWWGQEKENTFDLALGLPPSLLSRHLGA